MERTVDRMHSCTVEKVAYIQSRPLSSLQASVLVEQETKHSWRKMPFPTRCRQARSHYAAPTVAQAQAKIARPATGAPRSFTCSGFGPQRTKTCGRLSPNPAISRKIPLVSHVGYYRIFPFIIKHLPIQPLDTPAILETVGKLSPPEEGIFVFNGLPISHLLSISEQ